MDLRDHTGSMVLVLIVVAAAIVLVAILGLLPIRGPGSYPKMPPTTVASCPPGPTPTTAGVCLRSDGKYVFVQPGGKTQILP